MGEPFVPSAERHRAPGPRRPAAARSSRPAGVEFVGESRTPGVCHMGFFKDPDGNVLILHRRYAPRLGRAELLERYRALPLPTTPRRLALHRPPGLRPGLVRGQRTAQGRPGVRAEEHARHRRRRAGVVGEGGIEIERAPEGVTFEPLDETTSGSGRSSAPTTSSPRTTRPRWQHGLLVRVPEGRRARAAAVCPDRQLGRRRLAVLAPARDRRGGQRASR